MASSAIHKLGADILYTIFSINAEIDLDVPAQEEPSDSFDSLDYPSFDATLRSSQVCQFWRDLLLGSPNIWGKILRIERYIGWPKDGRKEIIKRTGTACLCIKGCVSDHPIIHEDVVELLSLTWSRVQRLDLWLDGGLHRPAGWYAVLVRPAPCLQSFKFLGPFSRANFLEDKMLLFGGVAPSLHEIHSDFIPFRLEAPWACQLRTLVLHTSDSPNGVLRALESMPLLRHLDLVMAGLPQGPFPAEKSVRLPNLASLHLSSNLRLTLAVAYALDPPRDCALVWKGASLGLSEEMAILPHVLGRYLKAYLSNTPTIESMAFDARRMVFRLHCFPKVSELPAEYRAPHCGSLSINLMVGVECGDFVLMLFRSISGTSLAFVTEFDFRIDDFALRSSSPSDLFNFFTFLPSLTALQISECSLSSLLQFPTDAVPFPLLQKLTIHLDSSYHPSGILHEVISRIHVYLMSRKISRSPILVLQLIGRYWDGDWSMLDSVDGLKVACQKDEYSEVKLHYTCGSGDPEFLAFRTQDSRSGVNL